MHLCGYFVGFLLAVVALCDVDITHILFLLCCDTA